MKIEIIKVSNYKECASLYDYLKQLDDIKVSPLNEFIQLCMKGRCYMARQDDSKRIVAGLCMYETKDYVFIAHGHINLKNRKTMLFKHLSKLAVKYAKDKNKRLYTRLNGYDYSSYKEKVISDTNFDIEQVYEIDIKRIDGVIRS